MLFPHNFAYLEIFFNCYTPKHRAALKAANAALENSLLSGELKSVRKIFTVVVSHATPEGLLHFTPNNVASDDAHQVLEYLMPLNLCQAFTRCGRASSNHLLAILTCGYIFTKPESVSALQRWLTKSNSFHALVGFEADKFQPALASGFLEAVLQEHFYRCNPYFFEDCLSAGNSLGSHTGIVYLRGNGQSPHRYLWHHPARAPFGVPVPVSCSNCANPLSCVLKKVHKRGSRATDLKEPKLCLECRLCGACFKFTKPADLVYTTKYDAEGIWVYRHLAIAIQSSLFKIGAKEVALAGIELVTQTARHQLLFSTCTLSTMTWAKKEVTDILHSHGIRYFESKGDDHETVLTSIVDALRAAQIDNLPDRLLAKVKVWYNNNISLFRKDAVTKEVHSKMKIKQWDAKQITREIHNKRYEAIKTEICEAGTEWHEVYRKTIARLWQELNSEEQKACQAISDSRNQGQLKEEEKRKLARANADKEVAAFLTKMHTVYGVKMLCLSSFTDPDGKAQTSVHETLNISPKFSQQFPKWKTMKGVANAFLEYSEFFEDPDAGEEELDGEDQASKGNRSKYPWAIVGSLSDDELPDNLQEYPLLPEVPKRTMQEWIGGGKIVIRAFVKEVYRIETGSLMPLWSAMATPDGARELVHYKYLPDGTALKDPSHMVKSEVEAIYNLWMGRQKKKKIPLRFKVAEAKRKIEEDQRVRIQSLKRKQPPYVETDDDGDLGKDKGHAERSKKKGKKVKVHAQNTDGENEEQEKRRGRTAGGTGQMAKRRGKQPAKAPDNNSGQSTGAGDSTPSKSRPQPRPLLTAKTREERLLHLTHSGPYRSLVFDLLRLSTS
ncbi:hypothetical protein B0H16DRAFT_1454162 [Mycena metata]|uniref:Uncharacterized protein n=1 Tax=Mycena metata TaxID=1033252 RepID=A0AAD7NKH3_9AGAR|nr:hypothetical protein B0H16DRAFT_1454162 [Mycena metata]